MDIDAIALGEDFVEAIETTVAKCDVLIAVIGKNWLTSKDDHGNRRLDNPKDFVRMEIGTALKRKIRVIPVLVDGALMPGEDDIPGDLKPLVRRNALLITDTSFDGDCQRLATAIRLVLEKAAAEERERLATEQPQREEAQQRQRDEKERLEPEQRQKERLETERRETETKERLEVEQRQKERRETELKERLEAERRQKLGQERLESGRILGSKSQAEQQPPGYESKRSLWRQPFFIVALLVLISAVLAVAIFFLKPASTVINLSGTWSCDDGASYTIQQEGHMVSWIGDNPPAFKNAFEGKITGDGFIEGTWHDFPGYRAFSKGTLTLKIESPRRLVRVSQTGGFSGSMWTRN